MTRKEKQTLHAAIGAAAGLVAGVVTSPLNYLSILTAPVSYPLMGAVSGAIVAHKEDEPISQGVAAGGVIGAMCVPTAPSALLTAWAAWPVLAAGIGGYIGWFNGEK